MLDAGLRPDECFRLRWENVRFIDKKRAVIVVPGTKTEAAARPVPMTPRVRAILEHRWTQAGMPKTGWVFPAKRAEAGHIVDNPVYEPQFVLYSLRHTCLTRWGDIGMDAWTLARLAGHSSIRQSMVYVLVTTQK
jgi:integrase